MPAEFRSLLLSFVSAPLALDVENGLLGLVAAVDLALHPIISFLYLELKINLALNLLQKHICVQVFFSFFEALGDSLPPIFDFKLVVESWLV